MRKIEQKINAYTSENKYDFDNKILLYYYPQRIVEKMGGLTLMQEVSLLELGLGHGYSASEFQDKVLKYTVLEGDIDVINKFVNENGSRNTRIINVFFEDYETEEKYDVIVVGFVLEHVDKPLEILKKYKTMLRDGGRIYVAVPNAASLNRRIGYEAGMLSDIGKLSETDYALGHKRYYDVESVRSVCESAGLQIKSMEGIYLKPFTTEQILALDLDKKIIGALCKIGRDYPELCVGILVECTL